MVPHSRSPARASNSPPNSPSNSPPPLLELSDDDEEHEDDDAAAANDQQRRNEAAAFVAAFAAAPGDSEHEYDSDLGSDGPSIDLSAEEDNLDLALAGERLRAEHQERARFLVEMFGSRERRRFEHTCCCCSAAILFFRSFFCMSLLYLVSACIGMDTWEEIFRKELCGLPNANQALSHFHTSLFLSLKILLALSHFLTFSLSKILRFSLSSSL